MSEICYRNEFKHEISQKNKVILTSRLRKFLKHDENSVGNSYSIRSLYFDTIYDDAYWDKEDGRSYREKFRIRYYNNGLFLYPLRKKSQGRRSRLQTERPHHERDGRSAYPKKI